MISQIALTPVLGYPLVLVLGLTVFSLFALTASIPIVVRLRWARIKIKYHYWMAAISFGFALAHGVLAASIFLNF